MGDSVLLTGATSGLGRWLAPRLGATGLTVLVHGRDPAAVDRTVSEVSQAGGTAVGLVADLSSLAACADLAAAVAHRGDLRVLVNNAGIGFGTPGEDRQLSADGFELRWAVNYLAPVALTRTLLPQLRAHPPARIVNVGSLGQVPIDFSDLRMDRGYDGTVAYRRAKLALAAWSFDLATALTPDHISVTCIHPATFMATGMVGAAGITPLSTVEEGGLATLRLITDDVPSGGFYDGLRLTRAHPDAYDPDVRQRLRAVTDQMLAGH